jgi:hypothetical protein
MIENPDFYQFGSGWRVARDLGSVRVSDAIPSTGLYYLILLPTGWRLAVYRDIDSGKPSLHEEFWAEDVCDLFGQLWSRALNSRRLESHSKVLTAHPHCFPRGRISKDKDGYSIFCGHDEKSTPEGTRRQIELIFGVVGMATWIEHDQERCLQDDREAARTLLQKGVTWLYWPAV